MIKMQVTIRPAAPGDADAIAATHVACWEETYRGILPDASLDVQTLERRRTLWANALRAAMQCIFVAEVDGCLVGFASAVPHRDEGPPYDAFLDTLYVRKSAQRGGVARKLLSAIAAEMLRRGHHAMALLTLRDRNAACGFYDRMGAVVLRDQPAPAILGEGTMDRVYGFPNLRALVEK
jgi:GNAT superfamily N-acetyltransferase